MRIHNMVALQGFRKKYIVSQEEFYKYFGDYSTKAFIITEVEGGRTYHLLMTGESFTVMDDEDEVKNRIKDYVARNSNLRIFKS